MWVGGLYISIDKGMVERDKELTSKVHIYGMNIKKCHRG
jgi:hypothetical protein